MMRFQLNFMIPGLRNQLQIILFKLRKSINANLLPNIILFYYCLYYFFVNPYNQIFYFYFV